ncbi:tRNA/rRNA methyltransferase [Affinibrenneria salicis]|uniref:tRNA/rRNA methyltransferase n=1 Tax=Affinibrenneria salicis TaxID=2590031 RepID=A0A5J5G5D4_9GAMM|nr:tRNA/rRNA methyltransferase [Affinibrenneria salicis]KAA9002480.1 tRNA/rRNA methyltransferase [Affinibrenneria salicis]KAA9003232.1 tRNA/rRNA methyltransferase [Affinibrenneria salicis]
MSDSFSGKSGKVRVMYVRSDDENGKDNKGKRPAGKGGRDDNRRRDGNPRDKNPRNARGEGGDSRQRSSRDGAPRDNAWRNERAPGESSRPRSDRPRRDTSGESGGAYDSPWRTVSRAPSDEEETPDHGGISGKSQIDPEQIRRQRAEETRVYGEKACHALFSNRPDAIVRAWFLQEVTPRFREALRWMAANRKAYHVVDDEELSKASGTDHHGGVCFLIKKRQGLDARQYLEQQSAERDCVLALENVGNPHNLGGILRSCAHFGVQGVLLPDPALLESGAAIRTAEGGAEHVKAIGADDLAAELEVFRRAGYTIVTTTSAKGTSLSQLALPNKVVLVLGQEGNAQAAPWLRGDVNVSIDGTGKVEGLNVSVATGILLAEWWRQSRA